MLHSQVEHYRKQKTEHTVQKMNVPSLFFEKATRQQEQIIRQYEAMVDDAEAVLMAIEAQEKQGLPSKVTFRSMKAEVFNICEALFQEQMEAAAQLERQERAIEDLKHRFVLNMQG